MAALITVKNQIRDFLRKYDEVATPILRFIAAFIIFCSINVMFGYSDLFNRTLVVVLISVLCALMPDSFMFFVAGVVMGVHTFCVSIEVGGVYVVLFVAMYCMYIRFFPKYAFVVLVVPVCYLLHISCLVPLIVAILAGIGGVIPAAFGIVLYYFSNYAKEVKVMIESATNDEEVQAFTYLIEAIVKNKEMWLAIGVFAVTITVTYILYKMSFDYAWYVAILVGGIVNIIFYLLGGYVLDISVEVGTIVLSTFFGMIIACIIQFCKGMVDYSRTELVQFEDDEYYYYVKAIPKLNVTTSKVDVRKVNSAKQKEEVEEVE